MRNVRDYAIVTASYWAFTITDGALRMLVLLFLNERGFSPLQLASLFVLYEFFGVVTNLVGGWLGSRFGLNTTLFSGLSLQILGCGMLAIDPSLLTVAYVMVAQGFSGIAKDLTKMSSKSYVKLVVPEEDAHRLLRWVTLITGSKNALKGVGFFAGGLMLSTVGFRNACMGMATLLLLVLAISAFLLPRGAGRMKSKTQFRSLLSSDARINWLAAARLFLFGSRDIWFVIALPVFLAASLGWSFAEVGGFMALWVIGYGFVQAGAPRIIVRAGRSSPQLLVSQLVGWTWSLMAPLGGTAGALMLGFSAENTVVIGLALFGVLFAINSAVHSYLIVAYAESEKVAMTVGFYYMANAAGRLLGTILSGALFQAAGAGQEGMVICIVGAMVFVGLSGVLCLPLNRAERRRDLMVAGSEA